VSVAWVSESAWSSASGQSLAIVERHSLQRSVFQDFHVAAFFAGDR
jgi:hypothetical protein